MNRALFVLAMLLALPAHACPFCDVGGTEAAQFILAVFVPVMVAGLLVLVSVRRSRRKIGGLNPATKIFDSEK